MTESDIVLIRSKFCATCENRQPKCYGDFPIFCQEALKLIQDNYEWVNSPCPMCNEGALYHVINWNGICAIECDSCDYKREHTSWEDQHLAERSFAWSSILDKKWKEVRPDLKLLREQSGKFNRDWVDTARRIAKKI